MLYPSFAINVLAANDDYAELGDTYSSGYHPPYHSNLSDQTIECIDNNVNINGIDVTKLSSPNHRDLINELQSTESEDGEPQHNALVNNLNLDKNLVNICANLNLNDQTLIVEQPPGAGAENIYVLWIDESNGGDEDIFFTVSNDNGQTFALPTDLSDNAGDSFEPQMIVSGNNVYVVWLDESTGGETNIFFTVSNDNGQTFDPPTDLSKNASFSENQQMIVSGNNVYVVWRDESNGGDTDILFTVSNDNGQTFVDPPIDLSNNDEGSSGQQMIVSGNNVYVVWQDEGNGPDRDIFFTVSNDNGQTFDPPIDLSNNAEDSFGQQMIVSGNNVYVVWGDVSNGGDEDIFFTVSNDNGQTFVDPPTDLSNNPGGTGHQQMIVSGNNVYVVWQNSGNDDDIFFTVSNDNGQTFVDPPIDLSKNDDNSENPQMIVQ
ncbi:MAG: sialidase family protein [Nitrososphaeraceae archaeon]